MNAPKDFDYDMWTTGEDSTKRYWIRIRATGETAEVSHEVMKLLRNDDRKQRRDMKAAREYGSSSCSCSAKPEDNSFFSWPPDPVNYEQDILDRDELAQFRSLLTPAQQSVFDECLYAGKTRTEYAAEHGISIFLVSKRISFIRKKALKFFRNT